MMRMEMEQRNFQKFRRYTAFDRVLVELEYKPEYLDMDVAQQVYIDENSKFDFIEIDLTCYFDEDENIALE